MRVVVEVHNTHNCAFGWMWARAIREKGAYE
jgi:hypothetical protein